MTVKIIKKQKIKKSLLGLEQVTKFLEIIFASGHLADEKPLSALLIAPVSNGKTTVVRQFRENEHIRIVSDCTAWGILSLYMRELEEKKIRHIIIPDLLNALVRRKSTVEQLIMFINVTSEEGLSPGKTYAYETRNYIPPFGWVLCITDGAFKQKKKFLDAIGFSSRFFKISYKYDSLTISKIINRIITEDRAETSLVQLKTPKLKQVLIEHNEDISRRLDSYLAILCNTEAERIRLQKSFQTFLKASAYLRNSNKVEEADLKILIDLLPLLK